MDELNKIRLLAGLTIDPKRMISEARQVPQHKQELQKPSTENHGRRVDAVKRAIQHLQSAVQALESIPAIDFGGDIPHYITQIEELITADHGEAGLEQLAKHYETSHSKFKQKESDRVRMEQEEESLSNSAKDAVDHHSAHEQNIKDMPTFEKGQKAMLHGEQVTVVATKEGSDSVGVVPVGDEHDIDAIQIVHVSELEPAQDDAGESSEDASTDLDSPETDDADADIEGDAEDADLDAVDADLDAEDADEDLDSEDEDLDADEDDDLEVDALSIDKDSDEDDGEMFPTMENLQPGTWIKTKDNNGGVVQRIEGTNVYYKQHNTAKVVVTPITNVVTEGATYTDAKCKSCKKMKLCDAKGICVRCKKANKKVKEGANFYYDTEANTGPRDVADGMKNADTVWKQVTPADNKDENPNQLMHLGKASGNEMEQKVRIPASIKTQLKNAMSEVEQGFQKLSSVQPDDHFFYNSLLNAYNQLLQHLEGGTVYDLKQAQIFMSTLMGPILFKIPAEVRIFIAKGGVTKSLKDYMKPVDPAYPITGPRQVLK